MKKKGAALNSFVINIILVAMIFAIFLMAVSGRVNSRDVHQQVLEKQLALLIDSADEGMSFGIRKINANGLVDSVEIREGRVFVKVEGLPSFQGYPYFSRYSVSVSEEDDKFVVRVG